LEEKEMPKKPNKLQLTNPRIRQALKRELMKWYYGALSSGKIKAHHKENRM